MNDKELRANLLKTWRICGNLLPATCVSAGVVFIALFCFNKIHIATRPYPRLLCYVTPSPVNEIMNSRLDTKADEGIFEHSKRERGGKRRGENIPKINFHLQGSCIFNRERLNIIG